MLITCLRRIIVIACRSLLAGAIKLLIPMELRQRLMAPMPRDTPRDERARLMIQTRLFKSVPGWTKPVVVVSLALLVSFGCKEQSSSSPPSGGMPAPPSGGMPAPPSGGMPQPPSPSGGSSGDSGSPAPPMPSGGSQGQGEGSDSSPSGSEGEGGSSGDGSTSSSDGEEGSSGDIGSFPGEGAETGGEESTSGGSESEESSDWDEEGDANEECGDTGSLPGGVGGMGQDGECIGGGSSASESDSASESSGGGGGGGTSDGEESAVQGTGGAGEVAEFPAESSAERADRLGKELDESIGGFDEVLMEEQEEISSVGRNTEGFGGGVEGDGGISLGQQSTNSTGGITVANSGALPQSPTSNMSDEQIRERTPEDIPVMADEDIIARQLREAALSEEDPELRDRLWEEYRKYSGN